MPSEASTWCAVTNVVRGYGRMAWRPAPATCAGAIGTGHGTGRRPGVVRMLLISKGQEPLNHETIFRRDADRRGHGAPALQRLRPLAASAGTRRDGQIGRA